MENKDLFVRLVRELTAKGATVATAESCTGGGIAKAITDISGSSAVLLGGFVTYTNEVKMALLGVDPALIARESEVSHACAKAMAQGARARLGATIAVSATGYAGPTGGTEKDPVGTVYLGLATETACISERFCAPVGASRTEVREAAIRRVGEMILEQAARL